MPTVHHYHVWVIDTTTDPQQERPSLPLSYAMAQRVVEYTRLYARGLETQIVHCTSTPCLRPQNSFTPQTLLLMFDRLPRHRQR